MRNEDAAATHDALRAIRKQSDPEARRASARELELHYSRTVITLRAVQDDATVEIERRSAARSVGQQMSDAAVEGNARR